MKYIVEFKDLLTGAVSPIDNIEAPEGYTAEQYISDCASNADQEWNEMLAHGKVIIVYE